MGLIEMRRREFYRIAPRGKFFSVTFIKRTTGKERRMLCRLGVKSHLQGGSLPYSAKDAHLVVVWDVQKKAYRTIPLENIISILANGVFYKIKDIEPGTEVAANKDTSMGLGK